MPSRFAVAFALTLAAVSAVPALAADPPADVLKSLPQGVVVHLGATDAALEAAVAAPGTRLVQGLAADAQTADAARRAVAAAGLSGLATVDAAADFRALPYADNLVNALIADLDALGPKAPAAGEILRVLTPGTGVAHVKRGGAWAVVTKPRPAALDDWTHFDHAADGNGVSRDTAVGEPDALQWISGLQPTITGDNPAKYKPSTAFRVAGGRAYYTWATGQAKVAKTIDYFLSARDAFNGVPLWNIPNKISVLEWGLVADENRVYTFLDKNTFPVGIDGATGKTVLTFDKGLKLTNRSELTTLRLVPGTLVQTADTEIVALDPATGALKWSYKSDKTLFATTVADGKVFAIQTASKLDFGRWPSTRAAGAVCLDLATGKVVWTSADVADRKIGQAIYADGKLALFGPAGIGALDSEPVYTGALDAATGKRLWENTYKGGGHYNQTWGLNAVVRGGALYYATPWNLFKADLATGNRDLFWGSGYNQRCNRFAATDKFFVIGLGSWIDTATGRGEVWSVSRSGCAQGITPANGLSYYTPNVCGCITQVRGHLAFATAAPPAPVADAARVRHDGVTVLAAPAKRVALETPLTREWKYFFAQQKLETDPVRVGDDTLVAVMHENRLERRGPDGTPRWSAVVGGRVTSPPLVLNNVAYLGAHDGCVYALDVDTGALKWRFLAAPADRRVMAYGQLSSAWPVLGVVAHQGKIAASAGFHPEAGGIHVWGLDPATGTPAWHKTLKRNPIATGAGQVKANIGPNRVLNDVLKSDGEALSLPGITFTPAESDAVIQDKVDRPESDRPKPKK